MFERYGSELALMDATYKTTRYASTFFVCVHTNVGYKVVAKFMCQSEDQASISEALAIIKGWDPVWNPTYFMVDYSNAEIAALEEQFPKSFVYICDSISTPVLLTSESREICASSPSDQLRA